MVAEYALVSCALLPQSNARGGDQASAWQLLYREINEGAQAFVDAKDTWVLWDTTVEDDEDAAVLLDNKGALNVLKRSYAYTTVYQLKAVQSIVGEEHGPLQPSITTTPEYEMLNVIAKANWEQNQALMDYLNGEKDADEKTAIQQLFITVGADKRLNKLSPVDKENLLRGLRGRWLQRFKAKPTSVSVRRWIEKRYNVYVT
jgi:hypothetical protein